MKIPENVKKVLVVTSTVIAVILLVWFAGSKLARGIGYLFSILSPIILGYIFALFINPIADRLQKKFKVPRTVSVIIVMITVIGALAALIAGITNNVVSEVKSLAENWTDMVTYLRESWESLLVQWNNLYQAMPDFLQNALSRLGTNMYTQAMNLMANVQVVSGAHSVVKSLPRGIIWTIIFVLSMFFMVTQKKSVDGFLHKLLGEKIVNKIVEIKDECKKFMWGYIKAQLILMVIVFFILIIPLSILNAPYAIIVSLITAFLDALPFFGSGFTLWSLSIICFVTGDLILGIAYIAIYLAIMLMRRFLEPKLISDNMGLHPVVTLATMYVGYCWWGLIGLITGPISFMLILSVYKVGIFDGIISVLKRLWFFIKKETKIFADYLKNITQ